jgi:hypothetical protein
MVITQDVSGANFKNVADVDVSASAGGSSCTLPPMLCDHPCPAVCLLLRSSSEEMIPDKPSNLAKSVTVE